MTDDAHRRPADHAARSRTTTCREPELSIVIPALNEELTVGEFVAWCKEGLAAAGVVGEILIVDSSDDDTAQLALAGGARVLKVPKRGLGRAYIDALPYVRGKWIVMGDADCTYDFRQLAPFVERFREGYEYVMGSRWKGSIEPGSMPALHRYFGTPFTTWILNRLYASHFSDIHCGMRGITRDALERMNLQSQSWEYASEMVLKSVHMELRTAEVPVTFLKDREGRLSHHKREGWLSPFKAAWINLRAMFIYGSDFFLVKPGIALTLLGLLLTLPLTFGDIDIGSLQLSLNWQFLGVAVLAVGCQTLFFGCVAQVLFDYTGRHSHRWRRIFPYTRTVLIAFGLVVLGVALGDPAGRHLRHERPRAQRQRRGREPPRGDRPRLGDHRRPALRVHAAAARHDHRDDPLGARWSEAPMTRTRIPWTAPSSFGQHRPSTPVDRFGVWLSSVAVRRNAQFDGARLADFGCGFEASFTRSQLEAVRSALLVDVALADDLKAHPKVTAIEGSIPTCCRRSRRRRSTSRCASRCSSTSGIPRPRCVSCAGSRRRDGVVLLTCRRGGQARSSSRRSGSG